MSVDMAGRAGWVAFGILMVGLFAASWYADTTLDVAGSSAALSGAQISWLIGLVVIGASVLISGQAVNGRWSGALIDSRNRYSLAQTQAVIWLIVVSSAIVAAGVSNVQRGIKDPLDLAIPVELLAVIGLSVTSVVGSPLIRSSKLDNSPDLEQAQRTIDKLGKGEAKVQGSQVVAFSAGDSTAPETRPDVTTEGSVVAYADPDSTGWADLLRGEETGNAARVDLGKLQLLYFTAVAIGVYGAGIFSAFAASATDRTTVLQLPALSASIVAILALSHAGALGYQATPHAKPAKA